MPNKEIFGAIDPLEGSPTRETSKRYLNSGLLGDKSNDVKELMGKDGDYQEEHKFPSPQKNTETSPMIKLIKTHPDENVITESSLNMRSSGTPTPVPSGMSRQMSPLKKEHLTNLPVRQRTKHLINSVQEILGYTELHPEVVQKILDLYQKVEGHDARIDNLNDIIDELKGLSLWEIQRMITRASESMRSSVEENT